MKVYQSRHNYGPKTIVLIVEMQVEELQAVGVNDKGSLELTFHSSPTLKLQLEPNTAKAIYEDYVNKSR